MRTRRLRAAAMAAVVVTSMPLGATLAGPEGAAARAALSKIDERGSLTLHGSRGASIAERGTGSGTFACTVGIELTLSGVHVDGQYAVYPRGGSIVGRAHATIHSATSSVAHFSGTIELQGGTGRYSGASGTASFDGTINRKSYAMQVFVRGMVRL